MRKRMRWWTGWCVAVALAHAAPPRLSRPVRPWEFMDATGPQAAWMGHEDGTLEAYVYPLKLFRDLRLRFRVDHRVIPGEVLARHLEARPGSVSLTYSGDEFRVVQTLAASPTEAAGIMRLQVEARSPVSIEVEFQRDFQLMWPASLGSPFGEWSEEAHGFLFGADGAPYAAVLGCPQAALARRESLTNYASDLRSAFTLGTINGAAERYLVFAGSTKSRQEALTLYKRLAADPGQLLNAAEAEYRQYLSRHVSVDLPDPVLQQAYQWALASTREGLVANPFLGAGLVAGYGPAKGVYRPGFAWFFGRDTCWTSFALTAAGDYDAARAGLRFIGKYQRADGKLPHEISQAAGQVRWFEDFPYGYASADATPLFVIAVRDLLEASGDTAFAQEQWERVSKAVQFMKANADAAGFEKNIEVGHGWVEGGPLLPVRTEFYQAGVVTEAMRSASLLAAKTGHATEAQTWDDDAQRLRNTLETLYWLPKENRYAFAIGTNGQTVDQLSVLASVPMWFGLTDSDHARQTIEQLASEVHATDWGMRILSRKNPLFHPAGYHFGSVWPLFTGWAAVAQYRYHQAAPALANLEANARLGLDGPGGNTTEVLSGLVYESLSTSSPHQIWSSAMTVSGVLRGMMGLEWTADRLIFAPHAPAHWSRYAVHGLQKAGLGLDVDVEQADQQTTFTLTVRQGGAASTIELAPALALSTDLVSAQLDGRPLRWTTDKNSNDWHPRLTMPANLGAGRHVVTLRHRHRFGYTVLPERMELGHGSVNLKVTAEHWSEDRRQLTLAVEGLPGRTYRLRVAGNTSVESVTGAQWEPDRQFLSVQLPGDNQEEYTAGTVTFRLRRP